MGAHVTRERECLHRNHGVQGDFYGGTAYVDLIQRLPINEALKVARNVTPFFWADAAHISVWLCDDCATAIGFQIARQTSSVA
jgi:hypothetical protein